MVCSAALPLTTTPSPPAAIHGGVLWIPPPPTAIVFDCCAQAQHHVCSHLLDGILFTSPRPDLKLGVIKGLQFPCQRLHTFVLCRRTQDSLVLQTLSIRRLPPPARNMTAYLYAEHDPIYTLQARGHGAPPFTLHVRRVGLPVWRLVPGVSAWPTKLSQASGTIVSRSLFATGQNSATPAASSTCFAIECAQECAVRFFVGCIWSRRAHLICAAFAASAAAITKNVQC
jgi:hypothetical protein